MSPKPPRAVPESDAAANTLAEQAAQAVQQAIVSGELPSGSKLRIRELMKQFGFGATPLREGLSRLVASGFVRSNSQRGFSVAIASLEDLEDILRVRTLVEIEALQLAMQKGDDAWEAGIVAALHRLRLASENSTPVAGAKGQPDFNGVHLSFHTALLAACGSPRLMDLHRALFDQTFRYRQVMWPGGGPAPPQLARRVIEEHEQLASVILRRDAVKATRLMTEHLAITLRVYQKPTRTRARTTGAKNGRRR
jgi:DNA-binding GntR family transcriptional regulator